MTIGLATLLILIVLFILISIIDNIIKNFKEDFKIFINYIKLEIMRIKEKRTKPEFIALAFTAMILIIILTIIFK